MQALQRKQTQILARPFGEADVRCEAHGHAGDDSRAGALAREDEPRSHGEKETRSHGETRTGRRGTRGRQGDQVGPRKRGRRREIGTERRQDIAAENTDVQATFWG